MFNNHSKPKIFGPNSPANATNDNIKKAILEQK